MLIPYTTCSCYQSLSEGSYLQFNLSPLCIFLFKNIQILYLLHNHLNFSEKTFKYGINMELRGLPFFRILPFTGAVNTVKLVFVIITKLQITFQFVNH